MLRPRKKYTIHDLRKLKGQRCLTHIHVKSPEEARAAAEAGVPGWERSRSRRVPEYWSRVEPGTRPVGLLAQVAVAVELESKAWA